MKKALQLISIFLLCVASVVKAQQQDTFDEEKIALQYEQYIMTGDTKKAFETLVSWYRNTKKIIPTMLLAEAFQLGTGTNVNLDSSLALYRSVADTQIPEDDENSKLVVAACCRQYGVLRLITAEESATEAINYLQRAVSLTDDAMALTILGINFMDNRKDEGLGYLKRAAERNSIIALELLGEEAAKQQEMDKAIIYWEKAAGTPIYNVANEQQRNAKLSFLANPNLNINPAVIEYQREACVRLADIYYELEGNSVSTAVLWLDKIVQDDDRSLSVKAMCYARVGRMDDTRRILIDLYNRTSRVEHLTSLGITEYYHGSKETAKKWLKKAMEGGCEEARECYDEFFGNQ